MNHKLSQKKPKMGLEVLLIYRVDMEKTNLLGCSSMKEKEAQKGHKKVINI
jgi:hypothetical protein